MALDILRRFRKNTRPPGRPAAIEEERLAIGGEMLRSGMGVAAGGVYFVPLDEIIAKKGWQTYRDMRHDDQVKAVLSFKKTLVGGRTWEIKPALDGARKMLEKKKKQEAEQAQAEEEAAAQAKADADNQDANRQHEIAVAKIKKPAAKLAAMPVDVTDLPPEADIEKAEEIAKFVERNLRGFNFSRVIRAALSAFDFGFSLGEMIYEVRPDEGERRIFIKDIKHRDPQSIEIKQDMHGNVLGFRQRSIGAVTEIGIDKVWHWAHQSEFGNAYGTSDLRAAYRSWWAKKFIINFWNVFLERMGQPMTMMKYPQGASEDLKTILKGILKNLSLKTEILVPDGVTVELVEATRAGTAKYDEALAYHDKSIARALLMIGLIGLSAESQQRGADSQSRLQLRMLFKMADEIARDLAFTLMEQVIKPLVDMNFEHENLYPEFIWQDYGAFEGIEVADTIRQLHAAGVVDMDQNDVNYVRSILGLPLRGEDDPPDEVQRPDQALPPPGNGAPPPAAPQGNARAEKGAGGSRKTDPGGTSERV